MDWAAQELSKLVSGKESFCEPIVDHYRRVVALVYVDGKLVNEAMIRDRLCPL